MNEIKNKDVLYNSVVRCSVWEWSLLSNCSLGAEFCSLRRVLPSPPQICFILFIEYVTASVGCDYILLCKLIICTLDSVLRIFISLKVWTKCYFGNYFSLLIVKYVTWQKHNIFNSWSWTACSMCILLVKVHYH